MGGRQQGEEQGRRTSSHLAQTVCTCMCDIQLLVQAEQTNGNKYVHLDLFKQVQSQLYQSCELGINMCMSPVCHYKLFPVSMQPDNKAYVAGIVLGLLAVLALLLLLLLWFFFPLITGVTIQTLAVIVIVCTCMVETKHALQPGLFQHHEVLYIWFPMFVEDCAWTSTGA